MFHNYLISNEQEMIDLGRHLSLAANKAGYPGSIIYLKGDLGAGKTTLVRGFVKALGHQGAVKSPTYTLVEPYEFEGVMVNHFDFYRINDPIECEQMGIRDYFGESSYCFVEWPQKGQGILPESNLMIEIETIDASKRRVQVQALDQKGKKLLQLLMEVDD